MLLTIMVPAYNEQDRIIRALNSIPRRSDIEVLIIDDGSTDNTYQVCKKYAKENTDLNIRIIRHKENKGLGSAKNTGYDNAKGDYINQLDADDWLYTDMYEKVMEELDGTDIVYQDLRIDNGDVWQVREETKHLWCGGTLRFIRREFLADHRCPEVKAGEDWFLNEELQKLPHTDKFTHIVGYHYTFPREGSLCDLRNRGLL